MIQPHRESGDLPDNSSQSPNELDQTDESQKADDMTRAGETIANAKRRPDARDERSAPRAPDGKTVERYAG